ncbi:uncharacterized protein [Pleurodeles waltl]
MPEPGKAPEPLHYSVGILSISAGSLLLAVTSYSSSRAPPLIPSTSLGVLLIIVAALLGYTGVRRSRGPVPLFVSFCLAVSALWCSKGVIHIMEGQGVLRGSLDLRNAMVPGLAAFTLGLLIISVVGVLQKEAALAMMALAIWLSTAHETATYYDSSFGASAVASNHLIVCLVGAYFGGGRLLYILTRKWVTLPGTDLAKAKANTQGSPMGSGTNDLVIIGLILNMVSASVFGCRVLGVTTSLFVGQVPWLWMAGLIQIGVCILSYRSLDTLVATFFGFTSILRFAEGYSLLYQVWQSIEPIFPVPLQVVFLLLFMVLAVFMAGRSLVDGLYLLFYVTYCIASASRPTGFFHGGSQGVNVAIYVASALMTLVKLYNMKASTKIPTGEGIVKNLFTSSSIFKLRQEKDLHVPYLGYSKFADAEVLGHAGSILSAFAITMSVDPTDPRATVVLPWVVVAGGLLKLVCGSVAFSRGKTLESSTFILYGFMWIIWGLTRYGGLYGPTRGFHMAVGIICFMLLNGFIIFCTLFLSKAWFLYCLTFELILISFLLDAIGALPAGYDIAVTIIFGVVSFYCFLSGLVSNTFEEPQLPMGCPLLQLQGYGGGSSKCPHLPARRATSVIQIAEIMKNGGVCGVPTDTVYVVVGACNRPAAVEKVYRTKLKPKDAPMSIWISSLKQLEPARHLFSPLLWDFMQVAWPSQMSLVIPRGEWLQCFGLKDSAKYIGTAESIAIRIPDCSVTTSLIDLVGPIVVSSANPSGEADTTHHNQVYAKLGDKVDGVLCNGPSPENIASTIVNCTKIDTGTIGFFRIGTVPKSHVLQLFEQVQKNHSSGHVSSTFTEVPLEPPYWSSAFTEDALSNSSGDASQQSYVNGGFSMEHEKL